MWHSRYLQFLELLYSPFASPVLYFHAISESRRKHHPFLFLLESPFCGMKLDILCYVGHANLLGSFAKSQREPTRHAR